MPDDPNARCEDRIDGHLAGRIEDLTDLSARFDAAIEAENYSEADDVQQEMDEYALTVDVRHTMIVQISTGGPGDQFEIEIIKEPHGWVLADNAATYRFLDWFDGATRRTDDEAVMAYLGSMVERLSI